MNQIMNHYLYTIWCVFKNHIYIIIPIQHTLMHTSLYICLYIAVNLYMYTCIFIFIYICFYIIIHPFIYSYIDVFMNSFNKLDPSVVIIYVLHMFIFTQQRLTIFIGIKRCNYGCNKSYKSITYLCGWWILTYSNYMHMWFFSISCIY